MEQLLCNKKAWVSWHSKRSLGPKKLVRNICFSLRWPQAYRCPRCQYNKQAYFHRTRHLYSCKACGYQTSLTAGTIFHKTMTPLRKWWGNGSGWSSWWDDKKVASPCCRCNGSWRFGLIKPCGSWGIRSVRPWRMITACLNAQTVNFPEIGS